MAFLREVDCDVLIYGNSHEAKITQIEGKYLVSPGSMTGAFSPFKQDTVPSFILIEYKGDGTELTLYVYKFINGQMDIGQTDISKEVWFKILE